MSLASDEAVLRDAADLIARRRRERSVERVVSTALPTAHGTFTAVGYRSVADGAEHIAVVKGDVAGRHDVPVHIHHACLAGDVFHALACDCGTQIEHALTAIERRGAGALLYLARADRGEGGHAGPTHSDVGAQILADLGLPSSTDILQ
ncbi:Riboflavin biosynthesis protein RibBA [Paraconexibacter sp. AEG42_29]|uniref:Riboflavin biosynthesis protein RibBA n=1 Tax=Paraconexibacter sp. AEG42_29 TaxID=2997339 RepID=A0AAU7AUA8_9ACTN